MEEIAGSPLVRAWARRAARVTATLAVLSCLAPACGGDGAEGRRPNVLVVVMDTARGDRCSFNGYERPTSPGLEEFARDAVTFRNAWSPSPWTAPSHGSLFTGLRPEHHGLMSGKRAYLPLDETVTLAERFGAAGYATAAFNNNPRVKSVAGLLQGFELIEHVNERPGVGYPTATATHREALQWIDRVRATGRPFFMFVNHMEPHTPYTPSDDLEQQFAQGDVSAGLQRQGRTFCFPQQLSANVGETRVPPDMVRYVSDLYDAEIATLDRELAGFLDDLRDKGVLDETVVVLTSDHGENLGDHGLYSHMFSVHRTLLHIPLIVRFPGEFDGGGSVDDVVRLEDVVPTVLELCGIPVPDGLDGVSLRSDLEDRTARAVFGHPETLLQLKRHVPGASTDRFERSILSVFDGRYHLISYSDGKIELYDVPEDPLELNCLAKERPAEVNRLWPLLPRL